MANISPTWYTWLEQGRGGAPSAEVLNRIAEALLLTDPEREHLFMLGLGRPPETRYKAMGESSPRLQRVLDSLQTSPAIVKSATWDIVAWTRAAAVVFTDYSALPAAQRNILTYLFCHSSARLAQHDWESVARFVVGAFRADVARAGLTAEVSDFVDELCRVSPPFQSLWNENEVHGHGSGYAVKRLQHPAMGSIELEYSSFSVDGRPDLSMIVYTPLDSETAERIAQLAAAD